MQLNTNAVKILFLTGCFLITTIAVVLITTSLCFFAGRHIASWQFPLSFILACTLFWYTGKDYYGDNAVFIKAVLVSVAVVIFSIVVAVNFYDVSYDGQSYHMEGIYQLKNGWNPFKSLLPRQVNMSLYINHYAKGVELPQSTLYSLINRIEAGKATNFILLIAAFCLTSSFLLSLKKLSAPKCLILSGLSVLNPVAVNQLLTTYVDGQLAILLLCFFVMAIWVVRNPAGNQLILLSSIIIIVANIKFTGLIYMVLFTGALLAWVFYVRKPILLKRLFYTTALSGIVAVFIVGYNPYVVNTIKFQHPFYPVMGKNKVDIMSHNMPSGFEGKSEASKFFISLFSHTDNVMLGNGKKIKLKIPFTVNKNDIVSSYDIDTRIAGFGPLFSGIIILSFILFIIFVLDPGNHWKLIRNWLFFTGILILSIIIMPEAWWARYIPHMWYFPLIILLMSELSRPNKSRVSGLLSVFIYLALVTNVAFTFLGFRFNLMMTHLVNQQLEQLQKSQQPVIVQWGSASANRIRFQENGILFIEKNIDKMPGTERVVCSDSKFLLSNHK